MLSPPKSLTRIISTPSPTSTSTSSSTTISPAISITSSPQYVHSRSLSQSHSPTSKEIGTTLPILRHDMKQNDTTTTLAPLRRKSLQPSASFIHPHDVTETSTSTRLTRRHSLSLLVPITHPILHSTMPNSPTTISTYSTSLHRSLSCTPALSPDVSCNVSAISSPRRIPSLPVTSHPLHYDDDDHLCVPSHSSSSSTSPALSPIASPIRTLESIRIQRKGPVAISLSPSHATTVTSTPIAMTPIRAMSPCTAPLVTVDISTSTSTSTSSSISSTSTATSTSSSTPTATSTSTFTSTSTSSSTSIATSTSPSTSSSTSTHAPKPPSYRARSMSMDDGTNPNFMRHFHEYMTHKSTRTHPLISQDDTALSDTESITSNDTLSPSSSSSTSSSHPPPFILRRRNSMYETSEKAYKILGITWEQHSRIKALRVLGISEQQLEQLGQHQQQQHQPQQSHSSQARASSPSDVISMSSDEKPRPPCLSREPTPPQHARTCKPSTFHFRSHTRSTSIANITSTDTLSPTAATLTSPSNSNSSATEVKT